MEDKEELFGTVQSIRFRNEENGYTVLDIEREEQGEQKSLLGSSRCTAVGNLPLVAEGEQLVLRGYWVEHNEYGSQFKFDSAELVLPQNESDIERYLGSGLIAGVGPATAKNIVKAFGEDSLQIISNDPGMLSMIKGISKHRALQIHESFMEQSEARNVVLALQRYGISAREAMRIFQAEGVDTIVEIEKDPYCLIDMVPGMGFAKADQIAREAGVSGDSAQRIEAAARYLLRRTQNEGGHTCYPLADLLPLLEELLPECSATLCQTVLSDMILQRELIWQEIDEQEMVFLPSMYDMESGAAYRLLNLLQPAEEAPLDLGQELAALEAESSIQLDEKQRAAVISAFRSGVCIITGGPGTGKTTILHFVLRLMDKLGLSVALAAPTGRAAKRLSEATGEEAFTLHRLLGFTGENFLRGSSDPLSYDAIVVDEMSMVDLPLFWAFLRAVEPGTRLILVGDADQLPSVGPGHVLSDLIESEVLPVTRLTQIFRQGKRSRIVSNAHRINAGEMPQLDYTEDFAFQQIGDRQRVLERVLQICREGRLGDPFDEIQILTPMKNGLLGVHQLNSKLQETLNPPSAKKNELGRGERIFREGDKVMQMRNNYRAEWIAAGALDVEEGTGVYNGDLGRIMAIDPYRKELQVLFDDGREVSYSQTMMDELELSYAMTIHKSQGSEFPIVLMPLCDGPPMLLNRNLLYTAVTRARDCVVILGWQSSIQKMVDNAKERKRYSALASELKRMEAIVMQYQDGQE